MYSTTSFRQLTPAPTLLPPHCWQARAFTGARDPNPVPTLWGWHCREVTLFPKGAPNVRAQGGFLLLRARSPVPPVGPLAFPEQHRQSWPLFPAWKIAGGGVVPKGEPRGLKLFLGTRGVWL